MSIIILWRAIWFSPAEGYVFTRHAFSVLSTPFSVSSVFMRLPSHQAQAIGQSIFTNHQSPLTNH